MRSEDPGAAASHKYWAFISHSSKDREFARWLASALGTFSIPSKYLKEYKLPGCLSPVYLDVHEAPGSGDLGKHLRDALTASKALIVLCSPDSAKSKWVNTEIEHYLSSSPNPIVCWVVVGGQFSDGRGTAEYCMPPASESYFKYNEDGSIAEGSSALCDLVRGDPEEKRGLVKRLIAAIGEGARGDLAREVSARMRRRVFMGGAAAALAAMGGGAAYLQGREKVEYFNALTYRWQIPKGVSPLSAREAARYPTCYKVVTQNNLVRSVSQVKSQGRLVAGGFAYNSARVDLRYDQDGKLSEMHFFGADGVHSATLQFSSDLKYATKILRNTRGPLGEGVTDTVATKFYGTTSASSDLMMMLTGKTTGLRYRYTYSDDGLITRSEVLTVFGQPHVDEYAVHGNSYEYDPYGRQVKVSNFGMDGKDVENNIGVHRTLYEYDARSWGKAMWAENLAGERVAGELGFAMQKWEYRPEQGPPTEAVTRYFGSDGKPTRIKNGFASYTSKLDEKGNFVEHRYFDENGAPCLSGLGCASMHLSYNSMGDCDKSEFRDISGNICPNASGHCGYLRDYDGAGRMTRSTALILKDNQVEKGESVMRWEFDRDGRLIRQWWENLEGAAVSGPEGYASEHRLYEMGTGNLRRKENRDLKGALVASTEDVNVIESGVAVVTYEYDPVGSLLSMKFLGPDDQPAFSSIKAAELRFEFEQHGYLEGLRLFGFGGEAIHCRLGFHKVGWKYTSDLRDEYSMAYYDKELKSMNVDSTTWLEGQFGYFAFFPGPLHKVVVKFRSRTWRLSFFTADGKNTAPGWGYSAVEWERGSNDYWNLLRFYNERGELREFLPQMRTVKDFQGRVTKIDYLNKEGELEEDANGIATIETQFTLPEPVQLWRNRYGQEVIPAPKVLGVLEGGQAEKMGIKAGDLVVHLGEWDLFRSGSYLDPDNLLSNLQAAIVAGTPLIKKVVVVRDRSLVRLSGAFTVLGVELGGGTVVKELAER